MNSSRFKRGQAAVEFLTTYGWALAVILVMISAMSFFGVTSPDRFVSERCIAPTGFVCEDFQLIDAEGSNSRVQLRFRNNLGYDINIMSNGLENGIPIAYTDSGILRSSGTFGSFYLVQEGSLSANAGNGLFGRDLYQLNIFGNSYHDGDSVVVLQQGSLEKVYVDVYYYRTRSGIQFNRVATFELIGTVR
ncbi:MAG: hypothetical protein ACMXX6_01545 [Candidatus Woesearchaeota archaeon]